MVVCAPDIALCHLGRQKDYVSETDQARDRPLLRGPVAMIELQHREIRLPTVDAGMVLKVFIRKTSTSIAVDQMTLAGPLEVDAAVSLVMLASVDATAVPAIAPTKAARLVLPRKRAVGLRLAAA
jgi:hypothetical protein